MKILIVNTFYYPNMKGGAEQSVKLLAEGLVQRGHEVAVYCIDSKNGNNEIAEYNGVNIIRRTAGKFNLYRFSYEKKKIGKIEKVCQKLYCYNNSRVVKEFSDYCKVYNPDIIHTNTTFGFSLFIWKVANRLGIPVVHTIRDTGMISPVQYGHHVNPLVLKVHQMYIRHMSRYVSAVTAPSKYTLDTSLCVGSFVNAKIKRAVFNSVAINELELMRILEEKRKRTSETIKFMYAGRLIQIKGIEQMVQAFEKLDKDNTSLYICGEGELKKYVEESANKNPRIIYCGKLNNEELAKKYEECDVLIVPSAWPEPFGRVVIEGNKYGLVVIATMCGGIPEIFEVTHGGELYNANETDELIQIMNKLSSRKALQSYYNNIENGLFPFGIEKQIDEFERIFSCVLK